MEADLTAAELALERADAKELHMLFLRTQERFVEMEGALTKVVMHYLGTKDEPRYIPNNDNAIGAMERVAMEALSLARFVVEQVAQKKAGP